MNIFENAALTGVAYVVYRRSSAFRRFARFLFGLVGVFLLLVVVTQFDGFGHNFAEILIVATFWAFLVAMGLWFLAIAVGGDEMAPAPSIPAAGYSAAADDDPRWREDMQPGPGLSASWSMDGVPWNLCPPPGSAHACWVQTKGYTDSLATVVGRCPCGAVSDDAVTWALRNTRRF